MEQDTYAVTVQVTVSNTRTGKTVQTSKTGASSPDYPLWYVVGDASEAARVTAVGAMRNGEGNPS